MLYVSFIFSFEWTTIIIVYFHIKRSTNAQIEGHIKLGTDGYLIVGTYVVGIDGKKGLYGEEDRSNQPRIQSES